MIPILFPATATQYNTNGIGRLAEATECIVTEERNGKYELTLTYPITGKYYDLIEEGMIIAATHDDQGDRQPFIIYRRSAPLNGLVTFNAHHRSYLLNHIILNPFTATTASDAIDKLETQTVQTNPFTFWTDAVSSGNFELKTPASIRSVLGGSKGSILDVYGGEYQWDNMTVRLYAHRGTSTDVTIRYGKNLTDIEQTVDTQGIYNAIVPFWFGNVNNVETLVTLPEKYVAASGVTTPVMAVIDFSSEFQNKPEVEQLRSKAQSYLSSNQPWIPNENIKISFVQLWQTEEYKDVAVLQRLSLCDRVNVYYPGLGVTVEDVEIIKVEYNVLLDRYDSMELGDARSTFASTLIKPIEDAIYEATRDVVTTSNLDAAINHATQLITGGLGGNVVFLYDGDGYPTDILVMDTKDVGTAVNVLRINVNGIGFSSSGINGPYSSAWTLDGAFVANFITAGTMAADRIRGGTLSLGGTTASTSYGDGVMNVYNSSNGLISTIDKYGITFFNSSNVKLLVLDRSGLRVYDTAGKILTQLDASGFRSNNYVTASSTTSTTVQSYLLLESGKLRSKKLQSGTYADNGYLDFSIDNKVILESLGNQLHLISNNGIYLKTNNNTPMAIAINGTSDPKVTINSCPIITGYSNQGDSNTAHIDQSSQWVRFTTFSGSSVVLWADASDEDIKRNITPSTENALEVIKKIEHYAFDFKTGGHREVGYIAQQLEKIIPDAVMDVAQHDDRGNKLSDRKQIHDHEILTYATKAIQELSEKVDRLEARIAELEA